jgi:hypothetical protein
MATRASIRFRDNEGNFVANIYHHYDGYPGYLGNVLKEIINGGPIENGISGRPVLGEFFNGFSCLVASVVAKLKISPGNVYLYTEREFGNVYEDYVYDVIQNDTEDGVHIFVSDDGGEVWHDLEDVLSGVVNI